jgi:hypothetical protein
VTAENLEDAMADSRIPPNLTPREVGDIFLAVEERVTEARSVQGQKRLMKMGGLVTAATAIATAVSVAAASLGFKIMGPPAELRELKQKIEAISEDREHMKDQARYRDSATNARISNMAEDVKMTKYLVCVMVKRTDPVAAPTDCNR